MRPEQQQPLVRHAWLPKSIQLQQLRQQMKHVGDDTVRYCRLGLFTQSACMEMATSLQI